MSKVLINNKALKLKKPNGEYQDILLVGQVLPTEGSEQGDVPVADGQGSWDWDKPYAESSHTHTKSDITDFPTSMPASDVSSWAKSSTKPTYTASEVGALASNGKAVDSDKLDGNDSTYFAKQSDMDIVDVSLRSIGTDALRAKMNSQELSILGYECPWFSDYPNYTDGSNVFHQLNDRVDLGTLEWNVNGNGVMYSTSIESLKIKETTGADVKANLFIDGYTTSTFNNVSNKTSNKIVGFYNYENGLVIYDSTYTDASVFKNAMSGKYLYYQIEEEKTYSFYDNQIDAIRDEAELRILGWNTPKNFSIKNTIGKDNKLHQKVGRRLLSSCIWFKVSNGVFATGISDKKIGIGELHIDGYKYEQDAQSSLSDFSVSDTTEDYKWYTIYVRNSNYNNDSAEYFTKYAMDGKYLYYELANEMVYSLNDKNKLDSVYNTLVSINNGTTKVGNADLLDGKDSTEFASSNDLIRNGYGETSGGKNLIYPILGTTTQSGITCTNNGDGTYTLNGTASATATFDILSFNSTEWNNLVAKNVKLVGCPSGGSLDTYVLYTNGSFGNANFCTNTNGVTISSTQSTSNVKIRIQVSSGQVCSNLIFKPMIAEDSTATYNDYAPYYDSNKTLTKKINSTIKTLYDGGYNQFFDGSLFDYSSAYYNVSYNSSTDKYNLTLKNSSITWARIPMINPFGTNKNHKFYIEFVSSTPLMQYLLLYVANSGGGDLTTVSNSDILDRDENRFIAVCEKDYFEFNINEYWATYDSLDFNIKITDLTEWFGSGNEPTSLTVVDSIIKEFSNDKGKASGILELTTRDFELQKFDYVCPNINGVRNYNDTNGLLHRKISRIDLGSLTWNRQNPNNVYFFHTGISLNSVANNSNFFLSKGYSFFNSTVGWANMPDKSICIQPSFIRIRDDSITDAESFKSAMNNIYLYYELQTEETYLTYDTPSATEMISDEWINDGRQYLQGEYRIHDNCLYKCLANHRNMNPKLHPEYWEKCKLTDIMGWNLVGTTVGSVSIALPSTFSELYIEVAIKENDTILLNVTIPKIVLSSTERRYRLGSITASDAFVGAIVGATTSVAYLYMATDKYGDCTSTSKITVYAR